VLLCTMAVVLVAAMSCHPVAGAKWDDAVHGAAEQALLAVSKATGQELKLKEVALGQVYVGRQHHLGLSIDGINYEVVLGNDKELSDQASKDRLALPQARMEPTQLSTKTGTSLLVREPWQHVDQSTHTLALPDVVLSGPFELLVKENVPVTLFTPHAADAGPVRRLRVCAGVTVRVSGLKTIQMRRHLDLPALPLGYLAEVYGHIETKEPGDDFHRASGMHYLASNLRDVANNASLPLLSLDVSAASPAGLVIYSQHEALLTHPPVSGERQANSQLQQGPRLKVKRSPDGSVELSLRQGQVEVVDGDKVLQKAKLLAHQWAWPLPHVDLSSLVPYEAILRSILGSHPMDILKADKQGIAIKLTRSDIKHVRLMAFTMEAWMQPKEEAGRVIVQTSTGGTGGLDLGISGGRTLLEFDVVMKVEQSKQPESVGSMSGMVFTPVAVKLLQTTQASFSMSPDAQTLLSAQLMGVANGSLPLPLGFDHQDLGVAQRAAE